MWPRVWWSLVGCKPRRLTELLNCWAGFDWSVRREEVLRLVQNILFGVWYASPCPLCTTGCTSGWLLPDWSWNISLLQLQASFSKLHPVAHKAMDTVTVYHGNISRETGERLLLATGLDGSYLLRDSESVPGVYCLCVLWVHSSWGSGLWSAGVAVMDG